MKDTHSPYTHNSIDPDASDNAYEGDYHEGDYNSYAAYDAYGEPYQHSAYEVYDDDGYAPEDYGEDYDQEAFDQGTFYDESYSDENYSDEGYGEGYSEGYEEGYQDEHAYAEHFAQENGDFVLYHEPYIPEDERLPAEPRWTRRRVIWLVIALIIIAGLILLFVLPLVNHLLMPSTPTPIQPGSMI